MTQKTMDRSSDAARGEQQTEKKVHVLFVDDDKNLLAGLKRSFHSQRDKWEMHFATSADQAKEMMAKAYMSVIVVDMRMPKTDGASLLSEVKKTYPYTLRIVFSGEAKGRLAAKALEIANKYLAKPCSAESLRDNIEQLLSIQDQFGQGILRRKILTMDTLPSVPKLYFELKEVIDHPTTGIEDVAQVISKDLAMAAKILQLANTAFYAVGGQQVTDLNRAISLLGLNLVTELVLVGHLFQASDEALCPGFSLELLWEYSLKVGFLARRIAQEEKQPRNIQEASQLSGLLHDIGKLILAKAVPKEYATILLAGPATAVEEIAMEQKTFGSTHAAVGAFLAGTWGLPLTIVDVIAYHHSPTSAPNQSQFTPLTAVHIASALLEAKEVPDSGELSLDYLQAIGLVDRLPVWQKILDETLGKDQ